MKTNELEKDVKGLIQKETRKKKFRDRSTIIEHYSRLLRDEKLNVGYFLTIMANMDNKIVYEENEFPALDLDEIQFSNSDDLEKVKSLLGLTALSTNLSVQNAPNAGGSKTKNTKTKPNKSSKTSQQQQSGVNSSKTGSESTVMTRSKARKAASREESNNSPNITDDASIIGSDNVLNTVQCQTQQRHNTIMTRNATALTMNSPNEVHHSSSARQPRQRQNVAPNQTKSTRKRRAESDDDISLVAAKRTLPNDLYAVTTVTSSGNEMNVLHAYFDDILSGKIKVNQVNSNCVMNCGRAKATVLLPCTHQPTCNQCFVLFKIFVNQKKKPVFCPICKVRVNQHIAVSN